MVKVICAGPPKTGTKSLARALRMLGYNEVWDYEEALDLAFEDWERIWDNTNTDVEGLIEKVYSKNVEAVVDFPHSHFFDQFFKRWPDAKVILMTREEESWYTSFREMLESAERDHPFLSLLPYFCPTSRTLTNWHWNMMTTILGSGNPNPLKWKMWFRRHNAYVKSVVPNDQLLVYNVKDGWGPMCSFLDKKEPEVEFPFENKAGSKTSIVERVIEETAIVKQIKKEAIIVFTLGPIIIAALIYFFFIK